MRLARHNSSNHCARRFERAASASTEFALRLAEAGYTDAEEYARSGTTSRTSATIACGTISRA